ncbi:MAG: sugar transferase [Balneola sp.]
MEELLQSFQIDNYRVSGLERERTPVVFISPKENRYLRIKYFLEYMVALSAVIALSPIFIVVALAVKLSSKGPVLFKHTRYGYSGMPFSVYKFRTMVDGAHSLQDKMGHINEMNGGKLFKSDNDPRVTKLGKFLRKTSIDELPQLFNILKGEMTVIGPRPLSTPLEEYSTEELCRFKVKPGLGCIWQAYFRKETDFKSWMKTDVLYVEQVSLKLDLKLFYSITKNVLLGRGAR